MFFLFLNVRPRRAVARSAHLRCSRLRPAHVAGPSVLYRGAVSSRVLSAHWRCARPVQFENDKSTRVSLSLKASASRRWQSNAKPDLHLTGWIHRFKQRLAIGYLICCRVALRESQWLHDPKTLPAVAIPRPSPRELQAPAHPSRCKLDIITIVIPGHKLSRSATSPEYPPKCRVIQPA